MGHIGIKGLQSAVSNLPLDDSTSPSCEICAHANISHFPFPPTASIHSTCLLECIHCAICGPFPHCYGNFSYYILFIDNHSHFITLFLMKTCGEAVSLFSEFQKMAENFCREKICFLCVNNTPELVCGDLHSHCKNHSILYEKTVPDSLAQNGVAKQTNCTICSMAHAMLINANLQDFFWPFAVLAATHIKQQLPHSSIPPNVTPFELWFKQHVDLSHLHPYGAKCTAHIVTPLHPNSSLTENLATSWGMPRMLRDTSSGY